MKKIVCFLIFFITVQSLNARENPFFPAKNTVVPSITTNISDTTQEFTKTSVSLPSTARVLENVIITYKNLDGSISNKKINISKPIDWHKKITISQTKKNICIQTNKKSISKDKLKPNFKKIASLRFISFYSFKNMLKIVTKDKLLRSFKLIKPNRIVLDFKRDANFRSYKFKGFKIFKKLKLGNHSGYYRAVIELDGIYMFDIKKRDYGYLLEVK